jgi:LysM repeat protein
MFAPRPRRHPVQTFQFWLIVLCSFGMVTAWKLDLFPRSHFAPLAQAIPLEEPLPPPPQAALKQTASLETLGASDLSDRPADSLPEQSERRLPHEEQPLEMPSAADIASASRSADAAGSVPTGSDPAVSSPAVSGVSTESSEPIRQVVHQAQTIPAGLMSPGTHSPTQAPTQAPPGNKTQEQESAALQQPAEDPAALDLTEIDRLMQAGNEVAALRKLSQTYWSRPAQRPAAADRLRLLSARVFFQPEPHYLEPYQVRFGETLESIAAQHQLSPEYLARLNRMDPRTLRVGQTLKVLQGPFSAIVDRQTCEITIHAKGYYIIHFPVGFGQEFSTPAGPLHVIGKAKKPECHLADRTIPANDPENPLGSCQLQLANQANLPIDFGLHGTPDPGLVGQTVGLGAIRLRNQDAELVMDLLPVGGEILIRD